MTTLEHTATRIDDAPRGGAHRYERFPGSTLAFHDLNLRHLAAATAIARLGRLRVTAAAINMSQPALTQAVGALERQLSTLLFDRLPHGMVPTASGAMLVQRCERAFSYLATGCGLENQTSWLPLLATRGRRFSVKQLRAMSAVGRYGNTRSAAEEIGVRHDTLIAALRQFGPVTGTQLLQAKGSSFGLSEAGDRLVRQASLAAAELAAALDELGDYQSGGAAQFAIGTLPLSGMVLLPEVI